MAIASICDVTVTVCQSEVCISVSALVGCVDSCLHERDMTVAAISLFILEWTTSLDTSSRTLFVREAGMEDFHVKGGCPRHVQRRVT